VELQALTAVRITKSVREEGVTGSGEPRKDAEPESLPTIRVLWFLILTAILCLASNLIVVSLHELGHLIVAASLGHASSSILLGKYISKFPPFVWFGGQVRYDGQSASLMYLAPAFTMLIPVPLLVGLRRLRLSTELREKIGFLLGSYFLFWLLAASATLLPSRGTFEGVSDGAVLLRATGSETMIASPLGTFLTEWVSGVLFYAGWWLVSSYLSARLMKLQLPHVRLIVLSLSTFALLSVIAVFASVLATWIAQG